MPPTTTPVQLPSSGAAAPTVSNTGQSEDNPAEEFQSDNIESETTLTLDEAKRKFATAKKYVDLNYRQLWDDCYAVYKRRRVFRHYEGNSDPVIPESFSIIETLVANIAGGDPVFRYIRTNEQQTTDTLVLNGMTAYFLNKNQIGLKNQEWVRESLQYGTGILHVTWRDGMPYIENIALRDFFVDPTASAMTSSGKPVARYAGFQYLVDKNTLENSMIYNAEQDKMVPKYKNLDNLGPAPTVGDQSAGGKFMDKIYKDMFQGSTLGPDAMEHQVYVILIYDLDSGQLMEIGNNNTIIYQDDIPYQRAEITKQVKVQQPGAPDPQTGQPGPPTLANVTQTLDAIEPFLPFAVLRDYVDTSLFYGGGEMEVLLDRAEMLNDIEAMDIDNMAYQNTPMYQIDPQFADLAPEIETIPGAVYPIPKGALTPIPIAILANNLDDKKDRVVAEMRSVTAADEAVQGISQNQGRVTATEVSTQLGQAQNRFSTKMKNLQDEGYTQLATILYKMIQIFVTEPTAVRIVGPMGSEFKQYDPFMYNGEWEPHVELDQTIKQHQMEVGQKMNQIYQMLEQSPVYDPIEVQRFIVQHIDPEMTDEQFNALLSKTPAGPSEEQIKSQTDIQKAKFQALGMMYQYATPFEKAQIDVTLGIDADPLHEVMQELEAFKIGAQQVDLMNPRTQADGKPDPGIAPLQPPMPPEGMQPTGNGVKSGSKEGQNGQAVSKGRKAPASAASAG